jgi:hypothetical protein
MIPRLLLPLACLALTACGDPFAAESGADGPPTGALQVNVTVPGLVTFDADGFDVASPYFTIPYGQFGGSIESPGLPGGLTLKLQFLRLAEWCHPNPPTRVVSIVPNDTVDVNFTLNCDVLVRPVYFIAHAHPDTLPPFTIPVTIGLQRSFTLTTGVWYLDSLPVNQWPVTVTLPAGCHRDSHDDPLVRIPPFPPDTIRHHINVICGS